MSLPSLNVFRDEFLQFSIEKPGHWHFLPTAWSPVAILQRSTEPALEWAKHANLPFCCAMEQHDSLLHAYATMQVSARPFQTPGSEHAQHVLEQTLALMKSRQIDFTLIAANAESIVAGCRANLIRASYTLITQKEGEDVVEFSVLSRSYQIFAPGRVFSIGLSSSTDSNYFDELDFAGIIESVRVGN